MSDDNIFAFPGAENQGIEDLPLPEYFRRLAIMAENEEISAAACIVETVEGSVHPILVVDGNFDKVTHLLCCMQSGVVETLQDELFGEMEE